METKKIYNRKLKSIKNKIILIIFFAILPSPTLRLLFEFTHIEKNYLIFENFTILYIENLPYNIETELALKYQAQVKMWGTV